VSWAPPFPARENVRADELEVYDRLLEQQTGNAWGPLVATFLHPEVRESFPDDRLQPYFSALLNSPLVSAGTSNLAQVHRTRGEYSDGMQHVDREWAGMVVCEDLDLYWVAYVHTPDAVSVGVRPQALLALFQGRRDDLAPDEREKDEFVRAVIHGAVTEDRYKRMEHLVGERATVELVCLCGFYIKTIRQMQAFGVPDTTREHLTEWLQAYVDGKIAPTDAHDRLITTDDAAARVSASS
jgi:hypothetical protein